MREAVAWDAGGLCFKHATKTCFYLNAIILYYTYIIL